MDRFASVILIAVVLQAQQDVWKARRQKYPELFRITELAQSAPPEFAAWALLRAAESAQLHDRDWQKEMIVQAFDQAASASLEMKKRVIAAPTAAGSREEQMSNQAYSLALDRISLSTRAVRDMFPLDQQKAHEMFQRIAPPQLTPLTCADSLVPDVGEYYSAMGMIAVSGFSPEERKHEQHVMFLNAGLGAMRSPAELAPAAVMIERISPALTNEQLKLLSGTLSSILEKLSGDDRSFSHALADIDSAISALTATARSRQAGGETLAISYRGFLVRNFTGARCGESSGDQNLLTKVVDRFNAGVSSAGDANLRPIGGDETKPGSVGEKAQTQPLFDAAFQEGERQKLILLMMEKGKGSDDWHDRFEDFLHDVEATKANPGESDAAFFYRKCGMLAAVLAVAPPGEDRDKTLSQYVTFLTSSSFQQQSLVEWFGQAKAAASLADGKLMETFAASAHPVLQLYAALEQALPERPSWANTPQ
jgi:hypothetical protein